MKNEMIVHLSKTDYEMLISIWKELAHMNTELKRVRMDLETIKLSSS